MSGGLHCPGCHRHVNEGGSFCEDHDHAAIERTECSGILHPISGEEVIRVLRDALYAMDLEAAALERGHFGPRDQPKAVSRIRALLTRMEPARVPVVPFPGGTTADLDLCPFCAGTGRLYRALRGAYKDGEPDAWAYCIMCRSCGSQGGWAKTEGNAVRFWNMRTPKKE